MKLKIISTSVLLLTSATVFSATIVGVDSYGDWEFSQDAFMAQQFTTDAVSYTLDSVTLRLQQFAVTVPGGFTVSIYTDNGDELGTVITTLNVQGEYFGSLAAEPYAMTDVIFTPSVGVTLEAAKSYWIGVTNSNQYTWVCPQWSARTGSGAYGDLIGLRGNNVETTPAVAFYADVSGTPVTTVPEPGSFGLLGLGAGLALFSRRRRA
jgi:hypothetical protein